MNNKTIETATRIPLIQLFSTFKCRLILIISILCIFFIFLYICAQYYNSCKRIRLNEKYVFCIKFKIINFLYLFKQQRHERSEQGGESKAEIQMTNIIRKDYSFINKSFTHSISSDLNYNREEEEEEEEDYFENTKKIPQAPIMIMKKSSTRSSIYSSSASLLTTTTNVATIPIVMITDTTSLQTDIIDFYNDEESDRMTTIYKYGYRAISDLEKKLRCEINEKRPPIHNNNNK